MTRTRDPVDFDTITGLQDQGFEGFLTVADLRRGNFKDISEVPGVYLVVRECRSRPDFLEVGTGGHFKNRNPNVSVAELVDEWVEGALIVYIGQTKVSLQERIRAMIKFGEGKRVGHRGGRLIWQLKDAERLQVCWKELQEEDPLSVERELIQAFKSQYGARPFANLRD